MEYFPIFNNRSNICYDIYVTSYLLQTLSLEGSDFIFISF